MENKQNYNLIIKCRKISFSLSNAVITSHISITSWGIYFFVYNRRQNLKNQADNCWNLKKIKNKTKFKLYQKIIIKIFQMILIPIKKDL